MPLNINKKIRLIARKAGAVRKQADGFSHIEDVLDAVNGLIDKYGLIFTGDMEVTGMEPFIPLSKGCIHRVVMLWTLQDVSNRSEGRLLRVPGSGYDTDFDGTGVSKAITASRKAALILLFNLRVLEFAEEKEVEDRKAETARKQEKADAIANEKMKASNEKRKRTNELKECVRIEWPESHHGNYAWIRGRIHVFEKHAAGALNNLGKFNEREDAWLVPAGSVSEAVEFLTRYGCTVEMEDAKTS